MEWRELLEKTRDLPLINTKDLVLGDVRAAGMEVQLSRWVKRGKLVQLKRGKYLLAQPYRKIDPFGPYLAAVLQDPSYVSLQMALGYYDLIPEAVWTHTSLTTKRPCRIATPVGVYEYRHIDPRYFWGYVSVTEAGQTGFMARPEKALLDLFYFTPGEIDKDFLEGMRLQNLDEVDPDVLHQMAERFNKPKVTRAAETLSKFMAGESEGETDL